MKIKLIICVLIAACVILNARPHAQDTRSTDIASIEQSIMQYMDWYDLPGLAVGLIKKGEIFYQNGFGVKSLKANSESVTKSTIFSTASVTKLFVGTAIMQLYEENKIALNETVSKYLPYFKLSDSRYEKITIGQLLSHTSGLPDDEGEEFYSSWKNPEYDDDALKRYVKGLKSKKLISIPGEKYNYSNIGYEILGCVISEISGMSLEAHINKKILRPLGMQQSNMLLNNIDPEILASPHVLNEELKFKKNDYFPYSRRHSASGTLLSSIEDMCRFALAILNKGILGKNRILAESSLKKMFTLENNNPAGLSWHIIEVDSTTTLTFHGGGDPGFRTELILIPEKAMGVIMMTNSWEHQIEPLAYRALNIMLGDDEKNWFTFYHGSTWKIIRENETDNAIKKVKALVKDNGIERFHPAILNQHSNLLIDLGRLQDAIAWRKFNLYYYPKKYQLYDLLAEAYLKNRQKELAIENYEKSLALNPENSNAIEMLKKIK